MKWRLSKIQYPVYNLGPGKRVGIWVQGCDLACKGCVNQTLWSTTGGRSVGIAELFNWLVHVDGEFAGVTITGGEPFQQYEQLITFLHLLKTRTAHDVYCFTGYYLAELNEIFPDRLFSRYIDYLVDGRYVAELHEDTNVKGSSNQTLYRFVDGVSVPQPILPCRTWSVHVSDDEHIYMSGIPKRHDLATVCSELKRVGIVRHFK